MEQHRPEDLLDALSSIPVSGEDLMGLGRDLGQRLHRGIAVGFNTAAVLSAVRRRFRTEDAEKASATYFRFEALVRFLADEPDCQPCDAVFAAAALEPLAKIDNEITFRRESFLQRVAELQAAKRDGEPACTMPADH